MPTEVARAISPDRTDLVGEIKKSDADYNFPLAIYPRIREKCDAF